MTRQFSQQAAQEMYTALLCIARVYEYGCLPDIHDRITVTKALAVAEFDMGLNDIPRVVAPAKIEEAA